MPSWLSLGFQDSGSFSMTELCNLHDYIMTIMLMVIVVISYIMIFMFFSSVYYKFFSESSFIETIWSIVPALILLLLVVPSMKVLYMMEDFNTPSLSVKIVGHQWYWTYIVPFFGNLVYSLSGDVYDSYSYDSMMEGYSFSSPSPRLLSVNNGVFFPYMMTSRLLITSADVIHSFAVPSLGLKVDALPGRINQLLFSPSRLGVFFGQCSEICGTNHSFMPIMVTVGDMEDYVNYSTSCLLDSLSCDSVSL